MTAGSYGGVRNGVYYEQKRVEVYYMMEEETAVIVTAYVFYGKRVAEALESLHGGPTGFFSPELSLPEPDWKQVVKPSIHPAFLPIMRHEVKDEATPSLEILDLPSLSKIITFNWKHYVDDLGHQAKNYFFEALELGALQIIPDTPPGPGDVFTVDYDAAEGRYSLFRIQIQTNPGGHRFNVVGATGKGIKESARMAYDYLEGNASKMGIDRDISTFDTNIQVISLMQAMVSGARRIILPSEN